MQGKGRTYRYTFTWCGKDGRLLSTNGILTPKEAWEKARKLYKLENVVQIITTRNNESMDNCVLNNVRVETK